MKLDLVKDGCEAQAKSLREFGYPDVTAEMVEEAYRKWISGEPPSDVIEMFCNSAFEEHSDIFGTPEGGGQ